MNLPPLTSAQTNQVLDRGSAAHGGLVTPTTGAGLAAFSHSPDRDVEENLVWQNLLTAVNRGGEHEDCARLACNESMGPTKAIWPHW